MAYRLCGRLAWLCVCAGGPARTSDELEGLGLGLLVGHGGGVYTGVLGCGWRAMAAGRVVTRAR